MTEHIKEQISVFIDDELSPEECEFFVRRLQRDELSRTQYMRYQLIGAAIRGEHVRSDHQDLRLRLKTALEDKPASRIVQIRRRPGHGWKLLAGGGLAATVALAAVVALRSQGPVLDSATLEAGALTLDAELELLEPPSYVVPRRVAERRIVTPAVRLTGLQYLVHHGGYASHLSRTVLHSNVVAGSEPDLAADEENIQ